jgi:hypothetical protein
VPPAVAAVNIFTVCAAVAVFPIDSDVAAPNSATVVAAPPMFKVVAPVLKSVTVPDAVVRVGPVPKVIVGDVVPRVIAVAFGNVTVAFLMLPVPVVAPSVSVVAAPPRFRVVVVVLNTSIDAPPRIDVAKVGDVVRTTFPEPVDEEKAVLVFAVPFPTEYKNPGAVAVTPARRESVPGVPVADA